MWKLRVYTTISLLLVATYCAACWSIAPTPCDNMIYRLVEDVSSYYLYDSTPYFGLSSNTVSEDFFRKENIKLWRRETRTKLTDKAIEQFVYSYDLNELSAHRTQCIKYLGSEAYDYLLYAKQCEVARAEMNDPWYYPMKNDPLIATLEKLSKRRVTPQDKYFNRYVLQIVRALTTLQKDSCAVSFWEQSKPLMKDDIIKTMAERQIGRAYFKTGKTETALSIYARLGDITSLYACCTDKIKIWNMVYKENPNSPFFKDAMQSLLTHLDNRYIEREITLYGYDLSWLDEENKLINTAVNIAMSAIHDERVRDKAMWYYSLAALHDAKGEAKQALAYAKRGQAYCAEGSFMANSMRVLGIYLEAQTCIYNPAYVARLANDMQWLSELGRRSITPALKEQLSPRPVKDCHSSKYQYTPEVLYNNKMYWSDAINRILADVLAPKLRRQGKTVDALLLANMAEFWLPKNATGKAHSPNAPDPNSFTDHSNVMARMADSCSVNVLVAMYNRLRHPQNAMDRLVAKNGKTDADYWCDVIGTHCIAEHRYKDAVSWLKHSKRQTSTWDWYDRDPFCLKIGWSTPKRHLISKSPDYKLNFAKRMVELQDQIKHGETINQRAEAMILYGVGIRNQSDWCWALSRFSDSCFLHDELVNYKLSKSFIDKGLATMTDIELKAYYLHSFARNKDVMDLCPGTKTAKSLRAHCDLWHNYK